MSYSDFAIVSFECDMNDGDYYFYGSIDITVNSYKCDYGVAQSPEWWEHEFEYAYEDFELQGVENSEGDVEINEVLKQTLFAYFEANFEQIVPEDDILRELS